MQTLGASGPGIQCPCGALGERVSGVLTKDSDYMCQENPHARLLTLGAGPVLVLQSPWLQHGQVGTTRDWSRGSV